MNKKISIVGVGKLGLCLALNLERKGYEVMGVDISQSYIDSLKDKTFVSDEESVNEFLKESKNIYFDTDLSSSLKNDIIFLIVATPSLPDGNYDHQFVDRVIDDYISLGIKDKHIVICCTTMPQYCDKIAEKVAPLGCSITYNPEFIAQGTIIRDQLRPDMVLIGQEDSDKAEEIAKIYRDLVENNPKYAIMSRTEAEITKIALNCFLTTKIAYANMVGDVVLSAGGNPDRVLEAIGSDSRIGGKYLRYGYGFGGPCFPRDNKAFGNFSEFVGVTPHISRATDESNKHHLDQQMKNLSPSEIHIFECVTYKPESTLLVESQQLSLAVKIAKKGSKVIIRERSSVIEQIKKEYGNLFEYEQRDN